MLLIRYLPRRHASYLIVVKSMKGYSIRCHVNISIERRRMYRVQRRYYRLYVQIWVNCFHLRHRQRPGHPCLYIQLLLSSSYHRIDGEADNVHPLSSMYSSFGVVCVYEVVDTRQEVSESSPLRVLSVSMFNVSSRLCYIICVAKVKKSYLL